MLKRMNAVLHALKHLPAHQKTVEARLDEIDRYVGAMHAQLTEARRENQLLLGALGLPAPELWKDGPETVAGPPPLNAFPCSTLCREESFTEPYFAYWAAKLGHSLRYHRKLWEFVFICQALWERGALRSGARGLGFGVGGESLSAFFASNNCQIVATDMAAEAAESSGWVDTAQHAAGKAGLRRPSICADALFDDNVSFRTMDMNAVADDLTGFDFCWSACALEHLGSIDQGLAFIERSVDCLKPGGWAVHTTELNLGSDDDTVSEGPTVLFRRRDFRALAERLEAKGHRVAPLDFAPGLGKLDAYIDTPPYRVEPHLVLALQGYATTSFGVIVQRKP